MYFDHCDTPQELSKKISEFLKIATGRRITFGPGKPNSGFVDLIDRPTDETLRQGYAEARNVAEKFRKRNTNLPLLPDVEVLPLKGLISISSWCRSITPQFVKSRTDLSSEKSAEKEKQKVKPEDKIHSSGNYGDNSMEWDVFICHASEDKENFVDPLANVLKEAGIKVWYDRFELKLGDSLREKIDQGLANCRYGAVVLSKAFFAKEWPKSELDALLTRQNAEGKKVILPIWYEVTSKDVEKFSPILASKLSARSSDGIGSVVAQILAVCDDEPDFPKQHHDNDDKEQVKLKPDELRILRFLKEGRYVYRSATGLAKEVLNSNRNLTMDILFNLKEMGAVGERIKGENHRYFITDEGRRLLKHYRE